MINKGDLQIWKRDFDGFLKHSSGGYAVIDKPFIIKFTKSTLYIEPKEGNLVQGVFKFGYITNENSTNIAHEKFDEEFESVTHILSLKNLQTRFTWKSLTPLVPSHGRFKVSTTSASAYDKITKNISKFPKEDLSTFNRISEKIDSNQHTKIFKHILKISNLSTSRIEEEFFYKWTAFNILYGIINEHDGEKAGIENFALLHPNVDELKKILLTNSILIQNLIQANLTNLKGNNVSLELSNAIIENDDRKTWRLILLCIYQIRNNLFHSGMIFDDFQSINKLLKNCLNLSLIEII